MNGLRVFTNFIARLSEWSGKIFMWLGLLLVLELTYDTVARYAFHAPTVWSFDISYMLYGSLFMLGAAYTLLVEEHIRIEVFYKDRSPKGQAIIDLIGYLVFFFPAIGALLYFGTGYALNSWEVWEHAKVSMWAPPIYPFKTVIPIATALLFIQGLGKFIRCLVLISKGEEL